MNDILFCVIFFIALTVLKYVKFNNTDYKKTSGKSFLGTMLNRENEGEYLIYLHLNRTPGKKKILVNLYIPKPDGSTTEIDLVMLHETGIYVIESKNYSGWISADERNKIWTQTLSSKHKYGFYNPIHQNDTHIKALLYRYPTTKESWYKSYIVFGYKCEFKKLNIQSINVKVVKVQDLTRTIINDISTSQKVLNERDINKLYNSMKKYQHLSPDARIKPAKNIKFSK